MRFATAVWCVLGAWSISRSVPAEELTFAEHIAPIVHAKCSGCHHPGQAGPFSLLTYEDVSGRAATVQAVLAEDYMPPWPPSDGDFPFAHDRRLTKQEKEQFLAWIAAGTPAGDLDSAPQPPEYPDGWALGEPDMAITMNGSFSVPADGHDIYRSFVVPLDLPEDRWVKAIELRPKSRSVVHHALYFAVDSDLARKRDAADDEAGYRGMGVQVRERLGGYVPGVVAQKLPEDLALPLPAHTDLVLQTHFHPTGKPEVEQMTVGLYFTDEPPSRRLQPIQVPPHFGRGAGIDIPPGESRYVVTDSYTLPVDVQAYLVSGHAHYICSEMKMVAVLPGGDTKTLLDIPDWNLDWQGQYTFATPVDLPKGTVLQTTLVYDNSEDNFRNPFHPPQRIRWGIESTDEMGSVTLSVVAKESEDASTLSRSYRLKALETVGHLARSGEGGERIREQIAERLGNLDAKVFERLDKDKDGALAEDELPERSRTAAQRWFDTDEDGSVSRDEWLDGLPDRKSRRRPRQQPDASE